MIQARIVWKEKLQFVSGSGVHSVQLDTKPPLGNDTGPSPKELVAIALCGCTGMDVASLMKKYKQPLEGLEVSAEITVVEKIYPAVFKEINLMFSFKGSLDKEKVIESVRLSQTKYCAVSAMLAKSVPICFTVLLNGTEIDRGEASFEQGL
jgi:putative redox protein